MTSTHLFGYSLITLSAILLAGHWRGRRQGRSDGSTEYAVAQFRRRTQASTVIGVVGAGIAMADRIPKRPAAMLIYLLCLLTAGCVILALGLADLAAIRNRARQQSHDRLAEDLRKRILSHKDE